MTADGVGRKRSRRGQGDRLRTEVLDAVNRLLSEWGSDEKLTMRAVAKEVGVAAPSIYLHFSDKAELVWAALTDKYQQLAEVMDRADRDATDGGPRERLRAQVHAYCRFAQENPGHYRLMYEVRQPTVEPDRMGQHPSRLVSRGIRRALARCAEQGYPLALPLHQAAHTLWTGLHGLVSIQHSLAIDAPPPLVTSLADGLLDVLVGTELTSGRTTPATNEVDRLIAETALDDTESC
ncbi:TetR/AcrR family transcriptional regulator [Saccharopolyspora endophytica]|uniref:TetR/AcrR family transcriptional regulator n=1 Tax=Saccharopolyspora endophytica TaxID=543886 RepID=A0ABS5DBP9_9PSEU|nr:TetR/AcrR family transcriptional regulator [Saccharopolyspora endophytica]MBQ0923587.1 TetR/AcrR family transcriptional regulator [Saccharopolyspora endophytica]